MAESPRILELRRRVQADPASIAFAQLAEECRRAGANDEAVRVCRTGLARHPNYLSARVTLGRALIELGQLDEALGELTRVVGTAPDNLPAIRGIAEINQRRGNLPEALDYYQRALQLARHDPDLELAVERISKAVTPAPAPPQEPAPPVEALFDFDTLLKQLGQPQATVAAAAQEPTDIPKSLTDVVLPPGDSDPLAALESDLRAFGIVRAQEEPLAAPVVAGADADVAQTPRPAPPPREYREGLLDEFEQWLDAIIADRDDSKS